MRPIVIVSAVVLLILGACKPVTTELTEEQKAELAAEVDVATSAWWSSWETVDVEKGMSFVSLAPEAAWVGDDQILYGEPAMRTAWKTWAAGLREQDINFTDTRTVILAPDIAYTVRQYTVVATRADGRVTPMLTGVETLVWVKRDGTWKVFQGHESALRDSWQARLDFDAGQGVAPSLPAASSGQ